MSPRAVARFCLAAGLAGACSSGGGGIVPRDAADAGDVAEPDGAAPDAPPADHGELDGGPSDADRPVDLVADAGAAADDAAHPITEFDLPTAGASPETIVSGPDGALWFTESGSMANKIGRITPSGEVTEFTIPTQLSQAWGMAVGADHNLWFVEQGANKIARLTPAGMIAEFPISSTGSYPVNGTPGPHRTT